jgi:hypothetical protein
VSSSESCEDWSGRGPESGVALFGRHADDGGQVDGEDQDLRAPIQGVQIQGCVNGFSADGEGCHVLLVGLLQDQRLHWGGMAIAQRVDDEMMSKQECIIAAVVGIPCSPWSRHIVVARVIWQNIVDEACICCYN